MDIVPSVPRSQGAPQMTSPASLYAMDSTFSQDEHDLIRQMSLGSSGYGSPEDSLNASMHSAFAGTDGFLVDFDPSSFNRTHTGDPSNTTGADTFHQNQYAANSQAAGLPFGFPAQSQRTHPPRVHLSRFHQVQQRQQQHPYFRRPISRSSHPESQSPSQAQHTDQSRPKVPIHPQPKQPIRTSPKQDYSSKPPSIPSLQQQSSRSEDSLPSNPTPAGGNSDEESGPAGKGQQGTASPQHTRVVGRADMPSPAAKPKGPKIKFTPEDDALLVELKETKGLSWKQIADFFPGRSSGTLQVRYCTKLKAKGVEWSEDMVERLESAMRDYDNDRWRVVSNRVGSGVSAAACREKAVELEELRGLERTQTLDEDRAEGVRMLLDATGSDGETMLAADDDGAGADGVEGMEGPEDTL